MQNIDEIISEIIRREGGFVNDPDDPGGATKYGITIHTLRNLRGRATVADVQALSADDAAEIYLEHYFIRPKINQLPVALHATVCDMQVNAGRTAIKLLQRLLGDFGERVMVDGALGPISIDATIRVHDISGDYLVDAYGIARRNFYFRIADRRPASRKYARTHTGHKGGWIKRAEEFISPKYHMSEQAFNERVASWA